MKRMNRRTRVVILSVILALLFAAVYAVMAVISGICGIGADADGKLEVKPLAPESWDWWCVEGVRWHGRDLTVLFDRDGTHFGKGKGLVIEGI